jgi:hypothetical protein
MRRTVLSARAEAAHADLMFTLAAHQHWRRARVLDVGRLRFVPIAAAPESIEHLTLPHIAAVAEEFARATLLEASEPLVTQDNDVLKTLWERAEEQVEQWRGMNVAWDRWHKINVERETRYKRLRGVLEARNAIVHGLGRLTRRQTRRDGGAAVRGRLASVGITTNGLMLVVSDDAIKQCAQAAKAFIAWLDQEAIGKGLRPLTPG